VPFGAAMETMALAGELGSAIEVVDEGIKQPIGSF
jgi:hypothetical protein